MEMRNGRRWLPAWLTVLVIVAATLALAVPASLADACNSPFRAADLELTGSAEPASPNVNYTIDVTNKGPDCTAGVTVVAELAPGSTFLGIVDSDPGSWSGSGSSVVTLTLNSTLPSPPGHNTAFVTFAATAPSSPGDVTVHASVTSTATDTFPSDNEVWTAFGKKNTAGAVSGSHPQATVVRIDDQSIATTLTDLSVYPPAPPGHTFLTDLAIDVETPPAPGNSKRQAIKLVITFNAPSKPGAFVFHLNHGSNVWEVVSQKCGQNGPFPSIDSVSYNQQTGVATITVCTLHFSHYGR